MSKQKGLVLVFTGNGKGKTTSSLGMALRAWGQGMRVLVLQFIKGGWHYGELKAAELLGERFEIRPLGEGFIKDAGPDALKEHKKAAANALATAAQEIKAGQYDLVILDEINYALGFGLVELVDVLKIIDEKPEALHLVLTGRNAAPEVVERADLVTEMKEIKHPFTKGIMAQKGIEF
ncbi:MAG: cob(I)yrinic acid a,c-diamide adenosyltransferase [Bacillota bacterium]